MADVLTGGEKHLPVGRRAEPLFVRKRKAPLRQAKKIERHNTEKNVKKTLIFGTATFSPS